MNMQVKVFIRGLLLLLLVFLFTILGACSLFDETNEDSNENNHQNNISENNNKDRTDNNDNNNNENDLENNKNGEDNNKREDGMDGNDTEENKESEMDESESSSILDNNSPFPKAVDVVYYFDQLNFVLENHDGKTVEIYYESKGEESIENYNTQKVYVKVDYEDSPQDSYEFDLWISDRWEEVVQLHDYAQGGLINPSINDLHGMFEESFRFFMDAFNLFHDHYRDQIKAGEWKANFTSAEGKTIAGLNSEVYQINGGSGQDFSIDLADFTDFEITLRLVDNNNPHLNRKFKIKEISIR